MSRVSIVVNTYNRAESLCDTISSIAALDHDEIEVVVVNGPSNDRTDAVLRRFRKKIKIGYCPTRNLSRSRNIGIRLAAGDFIAFIDDDSVPDPAWLSELIPLFEDQEVAGVSGPVFDHTGCRLQAHYIVCDRFGGAELSFDKDPSDLLNVPYGTHFCSTLGTNSIFRRSALVAIGGFDEEFDYFLDETDVCIRLVDAGWTIRYGMGGRVYHRYLPSDVRNARRAVADWYPVLKNKAYFSFRHGVPIVGLGEFQRAFDEFVGAARRDTDWHIAQGNLPATAARKLEDAVKPALARGMSRAMQSRVSTLTAFRPGPDADWRRYPVQRPSAGRMHICFVSQDAPPGTIAGIARVSWELASGLAADGHVTRIIARAKDGHHSVDWLDGVWIHRVPDVKDEDILPSNPGIPENLWRHSIAVQRELERIHAMRQIDLVQSPNWDCEGIASIVDSRWRTVLGVYTPMTCAVAYNPVWANDAAFRQTTSDPIIVGEKICYQRADAILACGPSIVSRIEADYGISLAGRRIGYVPHGLPDKGAEPPPVPRDVVEILFVGRLEHRKGIDILLEAAGEVCSSMPEARFLIAGDASMSTSTGQMWPQRFSSDPATLAWRDRVSFLGTVSDEELDQLYRRCDIVVVPSRFESFGLPLIEAMMRGRPVVASAVGGMEEIVEEGVNGLLVPAEDADALARALRRLVASATERHRFGEHSRRLFLERYEQSRMIDGARRFYGQLVGDLAKGIE